MTFYRRRYRRQEHAEDSDAEKAKGQLPQMPEIKILTRRQRWTVFMNSKCPPFHKALLFYKHMYACVWVHS